MGPKIFLCRECGNLEGFRSRPRNLLEKYLLPVLGFQPVRCGDCCRRFYIPFFVKVRERKSPKSTDQRAA